MFRLYSAKTSKFLRQDVPTLREAKRLARQFAATHADTVTVSSELKGRILFVAYEGREARR